MQRLGLFLIYTLPTLSNKIESSEIFDDLLQDIPGNSITQTHVIRYMSYVGQFVLIQTCIFYFFLSCSSEFGFSQSYLDPQQVAICTVRNPHLGQPNESAEGCI